MRSRANAIKRKIGDITWSRLLTDIHVSLCEGQEVRETKKSQARQVRQARSGQTKFFSAGEIKYCTPSFVPSSHLHPHASPPCQQCAKLESLHYTCDLDTKAMATLKESRCCPYSPSKRGSIHSLSKVLHHALLSETE